MRALFVLVALAALAVAPAAAQQKSPAAKSTAAKNAPTAGAPLNINTATSAQLETLPGLGKAVAERIVEYRDKNGSFKKVEEILETARSRLCLLAVLRFEPLRSVSGSRQKSQQISPRFASGGRIGGRTKKRGKSPRRAGRS